MTQARYITVAELVEAHDVRSLQNLGADTAADGTADSSNTILLNAIERASAQVQSFAARGGIYTLTDLTAIQAADDWTLKGLVVELAIAHAYRRRGGRIPADVSNRISEAEKTLEDLRDGKRVFATDTDAISAGKPSAVVVNANQRARLNSVADEPFFPQRKERVI